MSPESLSRRIGDCESLAQGAIANQQPLRSRPAVWQKLLRGRAIVCIGDRLRLWRFSFRRFAALLERVDRSIRIDAEGLFQTVDRLNRVRSGIHHGFDSRFCLVVESSVRQGPPELRFKQLNHLRKYWLNQFVARRQSLRELSKIPTKGTLVSIPTILTATFVFCGDRHRHA